MSEKVEQQKVPLIKRHMPIWRATRRFHYQLDAIREILNDVLPHVSELDEKHFTVDALVAIKNLPPENQEELERYVNGLILKAQAENAAEGDSGTTEQPSPSPKAPNEIRIGLEMAEIERIVGGDRHFTNAFTEEIEHLASGPSRVLLLHNSLLVMAIGAFEVLVSAIATRFYVEHQEALDSDEKVFSFEELRGFAEVDDATDEIISRRITKLMYGEVESWNDWFEENGNSRFADLSMDYAAIQEAFQRRHIVLHNGGFVSRQYLQKVKDSAAQVGERLPVDTDYLNEVLDELDTLGTSLGILAEGTWNPANRDYAANLLLRRCFELMTEGRWAAAQALASVGGRLRCKSVLKSSLKCNEWLCRAEQMGYESIREDVAQFDTSDMAPRFELVRLVLLEDLDAAIALVPEQIRSKQLTRGELIAWPILRKLREHDDFEEMLDRLDAQPAE